MSDREARGVFVWMCDECGEAFETETPDLTKHTVYVRGEEYADVLCAKCLAGQE